MLYCVWPRMELPPLSPGIQERVIEVVVVFVTVRRGWSGGTRGTTSIYSRNIIRCHIPSLIYNRLLVVLDKWPQLFGSLLTLNLQIKDGLVWTKAVSGHTSVIPRILCFHCPYNKAAISMDTAPVVCCNRSRGSIAVIQMHPQFIFWIHKR